MPILDLRNTPQDQQAGLLARHMPSGRLWNGKWTRSTVLGRLVHALAREIGRINQLLADLAARETAILRTVDLLLEWETSVGIPDRIFGRAGELTARRRQVLLKLVNFNGLITNDDFVAMAAEFGQAVRIDPGNETRAPFMGFGAGPYDAATLRQIRHTVAVRSTAEQTAFPLEFDIQFTATENAVLEGLFNTLMPAHVAVQFHYGQDIRFELGAVGLVGTITAPFVEAEGELVVTQGGPILAVAPFVEVAGTLFRAQQAQVDVTAPFVEAELAGLVGNLASGLVIAPFVEVESTVESLPGAQVLAIAPFVETTITAQIQGLASALAVAPFTETDIQVAAANLVAGRAIVPFTETVAAGLVGGLVAGTVIGPFSETTGAARSSLRIAGTAIAPFVEVDGAVVKTNTLEGLAVAPFAQTVATGLTAPQAQVVAAAPFGEVEAEAFAAIAMDEIPNEVFFWDASDASSITEDGVPSVTAWNDQLAGNIDLSSGSGPIKSTINGNASILCDGVNDRLTENPLAVPMTITEFTLLVITTPTTVTGTGADLFKMRLGFNDELTLRRNNAGVNGFRNALTGTDMNLSAPASPAVFTVGSTTYLLYRVRASSAGLSTIRHLLGEFSGSGPAEVTTTIDNISVGANANGSNAYGGHFHEIRGWSRFLTDDEARSVALYAESSGKWTMGIV